MKFQISFKVLSFLIVTLLLASFAMAQDTVTKPYTFSPNTPASAGEVNDNFDILYQKINELSAEIAELKSAGVGSLPPADYDSNWFFVEKNENYDKTHNLETLPRLAVIWAASDSNGSDMYLMDGIHAGGSYTGYGSWLQRITTTSYRISTGPYSAMSAYGVDHHWNWGNANGSGWIKVLIWK